MTDPTRPRQGGAPASQALHQRLAADLAAMRERGLFKTERALASRQGPEVTVEGGRTLLNFCSNNYLGLSGNEDIVSAAREETQRHGYGMSSVRFICGTQSVHRELEEAIARFVGTDDAILYPSAFDANGGVFEPLFDEHDAIISDALNHASIIDGIRLCKAARFRFRHDDMADLEAQLRSSAAHRHRVIVTDGVFSMDGTIAQLDRICELADRHGALVMVDDSHGCGVIGPTGRGTHEHRGVMGRIDLVTGTLGKALGGAMGGFVAGSSPIVATLRQKSRPYLFSNSLAPAIAGTSLRVLERLATSDSLRQVLHTNTAHFRAAIGGMGYAVKPGTHPIVPVMLFDARLAQRLAQRLDELGILVTAFAYPVVPEGEARIRAQISAAHTRLHIDQALAAFQQAGRELAILAA